MEENSSKKKLSETMSIQDTVLKFFRVYIPNQTADDMVIRCLNLLEQSISVLFLQDLVFFRVLNDMY